MKEETYGPVSNLSTLYIDIIYNIMYHGMHSSVRYIFILTSPIQTGNFRDFCDLDGRNVEHLSDICISVDWPSVVVQVHLMVMFGVSTQTYPSHAHFAPERLGLKDNGFFRDGFLAQVALVSGSVQCIYKYLQYVQYIILWYKYVSMWPKCS